MNRFLEFVGEVKERWLTGPSRSIQESDQFGVEIAADMVSSLLDRTPEAVPEKEVEEQLKLSRGLVLAARIVDLVTAPEDTPEADMVSNGPHLC